MTERLNRFVQIVGEFLSIDKPGLSFHLLGQHQLKSPSVQCSVFLESFSLLSAWVNAVWLRGFRQASFVANGAFIIKTTQMTHRKIPFGSIILLREKKKKPTILDNQNMWLILRVRTQDWRHWLWHHQLLCDFSGRESHKSDMVQCDGSWLQITRLFFPAVELVVFWLWRLHWNDPELLMSPSEQQRLGNDWEPLRHKSRPWS